MSMTKSRLVQSRNVSEYPDSKISNLDLEIQISSLCIIIYYDLDFTFRPRL